MDFNFIDDWMNGWDKSKGGCRISKYFLLGGSPALCPNGGEIGCDFSPIPYKHSSFPDIPFGMPDFKLFCFQPLKSMLSLMKKDDSPFFRSESCNEAYWYFVPSPKGCSLPVHLLFLGTDIFENSCLPLHQQMNLRPEYCDSYGASFHTHLWSVPDFLRAFGSSFLKPSALYCIFPLTYPIVVLLLRSFVTVSSLPLRQM